MAYRLLVSLILSSVAAEAATSAPWIELTSKPGMALWTASEKGQPWGMAGDASANETNRKVLVLYPGGGTLVSQAGKSPDLKTKKSFADVDVHVEFMIPKGSNSGVKLMGLYEIQIHDSKAVTQPTADDCGGIYPRAEQKPSYHLIDMGTPPRVNAAKAAGEWQTLDVEFIAPRFDAQNKKLSNAKFKRVLLNDVVIHENVEVAAPTGKAWRNESEVARGPLLLQGDHGPVAFRNVKVRERDAGADVSEVPAEPSLQ